LFVNDIIPKPSADTPPAAASPRRIWARELGSLWREGLENFLGRWWVVPLAVGFGVLVIFAQSEQDRALLQHIRSDNPAVHSVAKAASYWGDWPGWAVLGLAVWVAGAARNKVSWRNAGLACLLATLMAGLTINCFRPTMGRPRPYTGLPDGLYGPGLNTRYHSFMSGHTAASLAAATALVIAVPPVGVPALGAAAVVSWSRMQLNKHHPSDLLTGGAVGILWGWCFGRAARKRAVVSASAGSSAG
jgi:membrane-associated phospholipid phosphatase